MKEQAPDSLRRLTMTTPERLSALTRIALFCLVATGCNKAPDQVAGPPVASASNAPSASAAVSLPPSCPPDMVNVKSQYCVDRFETAASDEDNIQLSPYYAPHPWHAKNVARQWVYTEEGDHQRRARLKMMHYPWYHDRQSAADYNSFAVSQERLLPNANTSFHMARQNCEHSGKRLCTEEEWRQACRGEKDWNFPYGNDHQAGVCNTERQIKPGRFSLYYPDDFYLTDPRLNLLEGVDEKPLLKPTGSLGGCVSSWGNDKVYDLVGNLAEWVIIADGKGKIMGGHYFSDTQKKGCNFSEQRGSESDYDYSLGGRCCADPHSGADQTVIYKISPHDMGPGARAPRRKLSPIKNRHYCPTEMVKVEGQFCIDAYEAVTVTEAHHEWTSPYYPIPALPAYQFWHQPGNLPKTKYKVDLPGLPFCQEITPAPRLMADSARGLHPHAYLSYTVAEMLCRNAGKRLCTEAEWTKACLGEKKKPVIATLCNTKRPDPSKLLYGEPGLHEKDPRYNFGVFLAEDVLALKGAGEKKYCTSIWAGDDREQKIYDMQGNLSEWAEGALLMGSAYSDPEPVGCEKKSGPHEHDFYNYRTGVRCCLSLNQ